MKKTELYTYTRTEIEENLVISSKKEKNDIIYITENSIGNVYLPNSKIKFGKINFINNLVIQKNNELSLNTVIGTFVTKDGTLVFNLNYIINFNDSRPNTDVSLITRPTYTSGKYLNFNNIKITIDILALNGDRIIIIEYDE
jgi:hypothetical protein